VVPTTVQLPAGPHTVRVTASGYVPTESGTVIESGRTAKFEARLQRDLAALDTATTPKLPFSYTLGTVGGADLTSGDPLGLGEVGLRFATYEGVLRLGHAGGGTEFGLLLRWSVLPTAVSPYLSVGYAWGGIGFGYDLNGGLRWDVSRGDKIGFSLLADIGLRTYTSTDPSSTSTSGLTYPLELTAEVVFR
jgi:hypothetical protein